jgi:tRNA(Ile)-lysidine synthase
LEDKVVVALSGGADSTVLLHMLRFSPECEGLTLVAAHFDHRMRPGSRDDLLWVMGLCRAWGVELRTGAAEHPPASENEARERRYEFLLKVMVEEKASGIVTGHHADDQVETVLFRVFRGTGLRGLAGIPDSRSPGLFRPLLPFTRDEILAYALEHRVSYRPDPTNTDTAYSRNFLRHKLLPVLDGGPIPGARAAVRRLARLARENEEAWDSLLPGLLDGVCREEGGQVFVVRSSLLAYHLALQNRLLREILRRSGIDLGETGTRAVLEFTRSGLSGSGFSLPGGFRLTREFELLRLHKPVDMDTTESQALLLPDPGEGEGLLLLDGEGFKVSWGPVMQKGSTVGLEVPLSALEFPLRLRGWEPGDRIQLPFGTKKLKKLFGESKIPVEQRQRIPILLDSQDRILWVAGLASSVLIAASVGTEAFFVGIRNVDQG